MKFSMWKILLSKVIQTHGLLQTCFHLHHLLDVVGSNLREGRNFPHGKFHLKPYKYSKLMRQKQKKTSTTRSILEYACSIWASIMSDSLVVSILSIEEMIRYKHQSQTSISKSNSPHYLRAHWHNQKHCQLRQLISILLFIPT